MYNFRALTIMGCKCAAIFMVTTIMLSGCNKSDDNNFSDGDETTTTIPPTVEQQKTTIIAYTNETKVSFSDNNGIKLGWEEGDGISVYDSKGNLFATFTLSEGAGSDKGIFTIDDDSKKFNDDEKYSAVYPKTLAATLEARENEYIPQKQIGNNNFTHLDGVCKMAGDIVKSGEENTLSFALEVALMSIKIELPSQYNKSDDGEILGLQFKDGSDYYTLHFEPNVGQNSEITAHIMMKEKNVSAKRDLKFEIITDMGKSYSFSIESDVSYLKGQHYLANIGNNLGSEEMATQYFINPTSGTAISSIAKGQEIWVIGDSGALGTVNDLKSLLQSQNAPISLVMTSCTSIDAEAFSGSKTLSSVSLPSVTSLGSQPFKGCENLQNIFLTQQNSAWGTISSDIFEGLSNISLRLASTKLDEVNRTNMTWSPKDSNGATIATFTLSDIILSSDNKIMGSVAVNPITPTITLVTSYPTADNAPEDSKEDVSATGPGAILDPSINNSTPNFDQSQNLF